MAKVYVELDYEVVQQAIKVKVPEAVEDVLRRYDLQRLIETAITSDKKEKPKESYSIFGFGYEASSPRERFEASLHEAIKGALEAQASIWLKEHPEMLAPALEKALPAALSKIKLSVQTDDDDD